MLADADGVVRMSTFACHDVKFKSTPNIIPYSLNHDMGDIHKDSLKSSIIIHTDSYCRTASDDGVAA